MTINQRNQNKYIKKLLALLIEKYESSKEFKEGVSSHRRPQILIKASLIANEYYDETNYEGRHIINETLNILSREGIIEVKWTRFQEKQQAERIYLNTDKIRKAYELAELEPKIDKMQSIQIILEPLKDHPWEWVRSWRHDMNTNLEQRKTRSLDLDDPQGHMDLVAVLTALPTIQDAVTIRVFSQNLFGDSKRFERSVEKRLLSILRHYGDDVFDTKEEYLDYVGLVANPKRILFSGNITVSCNGRVIDIGSLPEGIGVTLRAVREMEIINIDSPKIICIENLTSYYDLMRCENTLLIYIGGFPHKGTQQFLAKVKKYIDKDPEQKKIFHIGDIDYGGMRIFEYLRKNFFPELEPLLMDEATYKANIDLGASFKATYAKKLAGLLKNPDYIEWEGLIHLMLKHKIKIEQEAIIMRTAYVFS